MASLGVASRWYSDCCSLWYSVGLVCHFQVNSKATLMFSSSISDEVHENIILPDLPCVTDEHGSKSSIGRFACHNYIFISGQTSSFNWKCALVLQIYTFKLTMVTMFFNPYLQKITSWYGMSSCKHDDIFVGTCIITSANMILCEGCIKASFCTHYSL